MNSAVLNKLVLRTFAVLGAVMGLVVLYISIRGPVSFPDRTHLSPMTGRVESTSPDRYSIRFRFSGDPRTFSYAKKSGDVAAVSSALSDVAEQPITVLFDSRAPQKGLGTDPFFQVYEVSSGTKSLRTHRQVQQSWQADYRYGYLVAIFAFLAAGCLEYVVRRAQPNNSFKPNPLRGSA